MNTKLSAALLIFAGLISSSALATSGYLNDPTHGFIAYYNSRVSGAGNVLGGCFNCNICHVGTPSATTLNGYGANLYTAWQAIEPGAGNNEPADANLNTAMANVESMDSDGDGHTNISEISAGSNPGDSTSVPGNTGCANSGSLSQSSTNGPAAYNPNALNASCSKASMDDISKTDAKRNMQTGLLFLLPLFTFAWLKTRAKA